MLVNAMCDVLCQCVMFYVERTACRTCYAMIYQCARIHLRLYPPPTSAFTYSTPAGTPFHQH